MDGEEPKCRKHEHCTRRDRHIGKCKIVDPHAPPAIVKPKSVRPFGGKVAEPCLSAEELTLAAEAALAQAANEGLELATSDAAASGYRGVTFVPGCAARPWTTHGRPPAGGQQVRLGSFATKEEAALAFARYAGRDGLARIKADKAASERPPMTDEQVDAQADAEGLQLIRDNNASGFKGVHVLRANRLQGRPAFEVSVYYDGRHNHVGIYATAAEGALAYARQLRRTGMGCKLAGGSELQLAQLAEDQRAMLELIALSADAVRALARAESLELLPANNTTGFLGVERHKRLRGNPHSRPYAAYVYVAGKKTKVGCRCKLAEQAALQYARYQRAQVEGRGAAMLAQLLSAAEVADGGEAETADGQSGDAEAAGCGDADAAGCGDAEPADMSWRCGGAADGDAPDDK
jgi:hypothetical protein